MNTLPLVDNLSPAVRLAPSQSVVAEAGWYAAYTWARHEKQVAQQLEERQIQAFLPTYKSVRRWKDRRKVLELPLFPSYVFVQMSLHNRLDVLRLPGVLGLVCAQGKPVPVAGHEIQNLRQGIAGRTAVHPHPYLKTGRRVRVRSGVMAGVEGILIRRRDGARVVLSISLLQQSVSVTIDEADVEPVSQKEMTSQFNPCGSLRRSGSVQWESTRW